MSSMTSLNESSDSCPSSSSSSTHHLPLLPLDNGFAANGAARGSQSSLSPYSLPAHLGEMALGVRPTSLPAGGYDMCERSNTEPYPNMGSTGIHHLFGSNLGDELSSGALGLIRNEPQPSHNGHTVGIPRMTRHLSTDGNAPSSGGPTRRKSQASQGGYHPYGLALPQPSPARRATESALPPTTQSAYDAQQDGSMSAMSSLDIYGSTMVQPSSAPSNTSTFGLEPRGPVNMLSRSLDATAGYHIASYAPTSQQYHHSSYHSSMPDSLLLAGGMHDRSFEGVTLVQDPDMTLVETSFVKKEMKIPALPRPNFDSESAKWKAVEAKSHIADAHFVCAHLTTRVYCRPSCVAKKPERLRTTYFTFPGAIEASEAAGFRPCKRCKPEIPGTADNAALAVGQCIKQIVYEAEQMFSGGPVQVNEDGEMKNKTLKEYSKLAGLSPFHFHRCFKAVSAITPGEFVRAHTSLGLQDRLGMDSHTQPLGPAQIEHTLLGWTVRRARKTLGGALPTMYARGCPDMDVQAIHADTTAGKVAFAYVEFGLDVGPPVMLACLLGEDAVQRVTKRFPHVKLRDDATSWLRGVVEEVMKQAGREVQLPDDIVGDVRRARISVAIRDELEAAATRHRAEQDAPAAKGSAPAATSPALAASS